jgi:hypothetical protein
VTPCALYELKREDFEAVVAVSPAIRRAVEEADRRRSSQRLHPDAGEPVEAVAGQAGIPGSP